MGRTSVKPAALQVKCNCEPALSGNLRFFFGFKEVRGMAMCFLWSLFTAGCSKIGRFGRKRLVLYQVKELGFRS